MLVDVAAEIGNDSLARGREEVDPQVGKRSLDKEDPQQEESEGVQL